MTPKEPLKISPDPVNGSESTTASNFPTALDREIADRLRLAREKRALNQEETAERIGVPIEIYAQLEAADRRIDAWHLSKLAMALDLPISWFFQQSLEVRSDGRRAPMFAPDAIRRMYSDSEARIENLRQRLDEVRAKRKRD